MRFIGDLHIHSKYSRACSPALSLENIDAWCRIKGLDIVSTGDFTHPRWFEDLKLKLKESEYGGLYVMKKEFKPDAPPPIALSEKSTLFMLGTEISCIYSQGGKTRRVHNCIYAPNIEVVGKIIKELEKRGCKLKSDGRPIIGMSSKNLLSLLLEIDKRNVLIPAHAWTPWFAIFGSRSGFDSIAECFEDLTPRIFAIETGLSSDPKMNWRIRELDKVALVSSSDAHSLPNLGREANIFEGDENDLSYDKIMGAIRNASPIKFAVHNPSQPPRSLDYARDRLLRGGDRLNLPLRVRGGGGSYELNLRMVGTVEFIPDEGRYHYDGHRDCKVSLHPSETKKLGGLCPKCKKPVTVGVLSRVEELANEPEGRVPENAPQFWGLVELDKIIAEAMGIRSRTSKAVESLYWDLIKKAGNEMQVLLNLSLKELGSFAHERVVEAIRRVRAGQVKVEPGYDGEYGVVQIFSDKEKLSAKQKTLF